MMGITSLSFGQPFIEDLNLSQGSGLPHTPLSVKIKNAIGEELNVFITVPWGSNGGYDENCMAPVGNMTNGLAGKAHNCFSYALYSGQGGPYYGKYLFVVGANVKPINAVVNCQVQSFGSYLDYNALLRGFDQINAPTQNGDVIIYTGYESFAGATIPLHAAIMHNTSTGTLRQIPALLGTYEETSMTTVDSDWVVAKNCTKTYYRLKQPYAANSNAGVSGYCSNIRRSNASDIVLNITGSNEFCQETINAYSAIIGSSSAQGGSYTWSVPADLYISGAMTSSVANVGGYGGSYTFGGNPNGVPFKNLNISLNYTDNCHLGTNTKTKTVKFKGKVQSNAIMLSINPTCPTANNNVTISRNSLTGVYGYDWFLGGFIGMGWTYISGQGTNNLIVRTPSNARPGYVHMKVSNECGITDGAGSANIHVQGYVPPYCGIVPGLRIAAEELEGVVSTANIYPNPASNHVTVSASGTVTIYDLYGKIVKQVSSEGPEVTIDLNGFENGIYILNGKKLTVQK